MKTKDIVKIVQRGKEGIINFLWWGGEHAFFVSLALLALGAVLAGLVFAYSTLFSQQDIAAQRTEVLFEQTLFEEILDHLQEKQERFETASALEPRDLFSSD